MSSNNKANIIIVGILLICKIVYAQSNDFEWIKTFGGGGADEIYSSCIDDNGNIYAAGYFQGEINIDGTSLKSHGDTDALIAKFDKVGNLCWAKKAGGDYSENLIITDYAKKIDIDNEGNLIVAGIFAWTASVENVELKSAGNNDIFIIKYTPDGKLLWAKSYGSFNHDNFCDMDVDRSGNIYITGILNGPLKIDTDNNLGKDSLLGSNTFIAKILSNGDLSWIKKYQGVSNNTLISIDKNNNLYYGINFNKGIIIDGKFIEPAGSGDFIIQQLNSEGETIWQKKYSSKFNDVLSSIKVSRDNSLLISGKYANISEFKFKSATDTLDDSRTYYSNIQLDGSLSWTVNNSGPSCPTGTMLIEASGENYFSTDVFTEEISVESHLLKPSDGWFNSYLAIHDKNGKIIEIALQITGIISSAIPYNENSIIVTGTCANDIGISHQINSSGGFIDCFVGKLKCPITENSSSQNKLVEFVPAYTVFPNPVNYNICTVDSKLIKLVDYINVTDQEGKLLQYYSKCSIPFQLDLKGLAKGTYFVSIAKDSIITSKQIVVN